MRVGRFYDAAEPGGYAHQIASKARWPGGRADRFAPSGAEQLARLHAIYWALTGLWPLVHMKSFETVTGPKRDRWLVRTVSLLILSTAVSLWDRRVGHDARVLGATSSAALGAVSLVGPVVGRISPVYLIDAFVEIVLCLAWLVVGRIPAEPSTHQRAPANGSRS